MRLEIFVLLVVLSNVVFAQQKHREIDWQSLASSNGEEGKSLPRKKILKPVISHLRWGAIKAGGAAKYSTWIPPSDCKFSWELYELLDKARKGEDRRISIGVAGYMSEQFGCCVSLIEETVEADFREDAYEVAACSIRTFRDKFDCEKFREVLEPLMIGSNHFYGKAKELYARGLLLASSADEGYPELRKMIAEGGVPLDVVVQIPPEIMKSQQGQLWLMGAYFNKHVSELHQILLLGTPVGELILAADLAFKGDHKKSLIRLETYRHGPALKLDQIAAIAIGNGKLDESDLPMVFRFLVEASKWQNDLGIRASSADGMDPRLLQLYDLLSDEEASVRFFTSAKNASGKNLIEASAIIPVKPNPLLFNRSVRESQNDKLSLSMTPMASMSLILHGRSKNNFFGIVNWKEIAETASKLSAPTVFERLCKVLDNGGTLTDTQVLRALRN